MIDKTMHRKLKTNQFLFHQWRPSCYSCCKSDEKRRWQIVTTTKRTYNRHTVPVYYHSRQVYFEVLEKCRQLGTLKRIEFVMSTFVLQLKLNWTRTQIYPCIQDGTLQPAILKDKNSSKNMQHKMEGKVLKHTIWIDKITVKYMIPIKGNSTKTNNPEIQNNRTTD